jgi:hypothetical protein
MPEGRGFTEFLVIDLWFVPQGTSCSGQTGAVYGCSEVGGNNAAVTSATFSYDSA